MNHQPSPCDVHRTAKRLFNAKCTLQITIYYSLAVSICYDAITIQSNEPSRFSIICCGLCVIFLATLFICTCLHLDRRDRRYIYIDTKHTHTRASNVANYDIVACKFCYIVQKCIRWKLACTLGGQIFPLQKHHGLFLEAVICRPGIAYCILLFRVNLLIEHILLNTSNRLHHRSIHMDAICLFFSFAFFVCLWSKPCNVANVLGHINTRRCDGRAIIAMRSHTRVR